MYRSPLLSLLLLLCVVAFACGQTLPSGSKIVVLFKGNVLFVAPGDAPYSGSLYQLTTTTGDIRGIDVRPADSMLYGVTSGGQFIRIDYTTGTVTGVSTMNITFPGAKEWGFDFNPTVDRARLVSRNRRNARYNVDTGALTDFDPTTPGIQFDLNLNYPGSTNVPQVIGVGYTNSFAPTPLTTKLFGIDISNYALVQQNPPNNGTLTVIGSLGISGFTRGGFDVYTDKATNATTAILATNYKKYYRVDLTTGAATQVWSDSLVLSIGRPLGLALVSP
jgi:hypothetical protein